MRNRTLVFDSTITGHHLEYMHHIYKYGVEHGDCADLIFVVPKEFNKMKDVFEWQESARIDIVRLTQDEFLKCNHHNLMIAAWYKSLVLRRYVKMYQVTQVVLIMLMQFLPFLPFLLPSNVKVNGIIYKIYLYEWKEMPLLKKIQEVIKYLLLKGSSKIHTPFILNDNSSAIYLNKLYRTNKFRSLPDPINVDLMQSAQNIREQLGISEGDKVYLHFGGMTKRKGTLLILDALHLLSAEECRDKVFIFAGRVYQDIRTEFYEKLNLLHDKVRIIVYDEFCSYDWLNSLCFSSDVILLPYSNSSQSSGVLGYAAYYEKPVIGPNKGLVGKLIRKYKIGKALSLLDAKTLANAIGMSCLITERSYWENSLSFSKSLIFFTNMNK